MDSQSILKKSWPENWYFVKEFKPFSRLRPLMRLQVNIGLDVFDELQSGILTGYSGKVCVTQFEYKRYLYEYKLHWVLLEFLCCKELRAHIT